MKKLLDKVALAAIMLLSVALGACTGGDAADAEALLSTVPADASVVVFKTGELMKKTGCKKDGNKIVLSKEMQQLVEELSGKDKEESEAVNAFLAGEAGVKTDAFVFFNDRQNYLTGLLADPVAFKAYVEKYLGEKFEEQEGANVCHNIAYIGNQFWINMSRPFRDPEVLGGYAALKKEHSALASVNKDALTSADNDIVGVCSLSQALGAMRTGRPQASLALSALFEQPEKVEFRGYADKEGMKFTARLVNGEGKTSKFLLPTSTIDTDLISDLGENAEMAVALSLPEGAVGKLLGVMGALGGGLPKDLTEAFEEIGGTSACAMGGNEMAYVISTVKEPTPSLVEMIGRMSGLTVTTEGKEMWLNKGAELSGSMSLKEIAPAFKGAMIGVAGNFNFHIAGAKKPQVAFMMVPKDNTLEMRLSVEFGKEGWKAVVAK